MKGVKSLTPLAISLVVLTMVISVGGIMLTQFQPVSYTDNPVTNETISSSGSVPETFTVANTGEGLEEDSETIQVYDNESGNVYTLDEGDDYEVVSYSSGEFNVTNDDVDDDGTAEIDTVDDEYRVDYTYQTGSVATNILNQGTNALETFGSFFTVIVVVGIGAVLLLLLQVFRSAGMTSNGRTMA
jgi:hypothetical protein